MRDMNVCSTFYGNPSNSCQDILLKTTNMNLGDLFYLFDLL